MENITALNFTKICRVCLFECDDMFSIYSELFEDNSEENMPTIFEILASLSTIKVKTSDVLPTMICVKCINKAHSAYKFQQQCSRSQLLLESYMDQINQLTEEDKSPSPKEVLDDVNEFVENSLEHESQNELVHENDLLPSELVFINQELMKNDLMDTDDLLRNDEPEDLYDDDCDDLKNCIPLGEDTVDQLIKDNLQVENLEMISPKIQSFKLDLKCNEQEETVVTNNEKTNKELPNMYYYSREKEDGSLEYQCNVCQKSFRLANTLKIHLKTHDKDKPYVCSECKKAFKVYGSLMHHTRSHSGEQPYECKECGKKYKQSGTLKAHMRIHSGLKPFICTICGKGFRQAPDLTYHMRTHTKEKPYMCNICGKTMSMQCHLVQHMRSHTGEKPFKCSECDKAFPSSTRLKRHSIVHTNLKPYKCNICDKSFNRNSSLQVHTRIHIGIKSHICSLCNKSFLWAHSLRAHMAAHAKESEEKKVAVSVDATTLNKDLPALDFDTMTIYSDPSSQNSLANESFAVFANIDDKSASDSFGICAFGEEKDGIETFTLYSADSVLNQANPLSTSV